MSATIRRKHAVVMAILVCVSLVLLGMSDLYYAYKEARIQVGRTQSAQAAELAGSIRTTLGLVERQLGAVTNLPWNGPGWLGMQDRREEYVRLLRIAPSVESIDYVDGTGTVSLSVSRRDVDSIGQASDKVEPRSPTSTGLMCEYSRVNYSNDYDPFLTLALSGDERPSGKTVARINLRALADEVMRSLTVAASEAYVVDETGRIVLHKNPSLMLERRYVGGLPQVMAGLQSEISGVPGEGAEGEKLIASSSNLSSLGWHAIVEQNRSTALAPVTAAFIRTGGFLLVGILLSIGGAYYLANRLTRPILELHRGAKKLAEGDLGAQISVRTGDELEQLSDQFNRMSESLRESYANLEQKVIEKTFALEVANRHKSEFLASMSHELRTPLTAILGFSEALQMEMRGPLNARQHEHVADIRSSGIHLLALITDVLDLARIESGRLQLEVTPFDVKSVLSQAMRLVVERCKDKNVFLVTDIAPGIVEWRADERRFLQIVLNLLGNAVKFTPSGGTITVRARISVELGLEVEVTDTGSGIAPTDLTLVFEAFRQVGDNDVVKAEGTGLGLALVRQLVVAQGGAVGISSVLGEGTTVRFNLPERSA